MRRTICIAASAVVLTLIAACGAVEPKDDEDLVVEAFAHSGQPAPEILIRRTVDLSTGGAELTAEDVDVELSIDEDVIPYERAAPGRYRPLMDAISPPGAEVRVTVSSAMQHLVGTTTMPPPIEIDSISVVVPPEPVEAVLLDSLSLAPGTSVTGFLYMIEVAVGWEDPGQDGDWYVRTQLAADPSAAPLVIDLFLQSDQTLSETVVPLSSDGRRRWTGIYAVRVESADAPLPEHQLRVSLLRSGRDYARFAWSRDSPDRREPKGNVDGGIGIVAGISVDSLNLTIQPSIEP